MNRVILQVPLQKELKIKAEKFARDEGFSSLQEIIRVILTKFVRRDINLFISEGDVIKLSVKSEKKYAKMDDDFDKGKNVLYADNVDDLMKKLK